VVKLLADRCTVRVMRWAQKESVTKPGKTCNTVYMSTGVLSIRLPDDIKARLDSLAASTGRPAAFYVREAIAEHLTEIEYAYTLRSEAEAIRRGEVGTRPLDEVVEELGLD
jgi:RHH-type transcriptional regulator, rel operon repressor / antitoxin RelB